MTDPLAALQALVDEQATMGHANWCRIGRDHVGPCDDPRLAAPVEGLREHPDDDFVALAQHYREEHEATHGEAEQCGGPCIVLGLDDAAPVEGLDAERLLDPLRYDGMVSDPWQHGWNAALSAAKRLIAREYAALEATE